MTKLGKKVAIMDADIYGYSIPRLFDEYNDPIIEDGKIKPIMTKEGIEIISTQYFIENNENRAVVWRASILNEVMKTFFTEIKWNQELDYLLLICHQEQVTLC
jgi:ATP-binding protein involved in chromosome partitioning